MISQKAQVLVEFAIATVGVLVLAFICGRVAVWLNESLVERNASYQESRVQAGEYGKLQKEGDPITTFDAPADIHLVGKEASVYDKINKLGEEARRSIDKIMNENGVKVKTTGMDSLFLTHFLTDKVRDVKNARDAASCDVDLQKAYHFALMAKYGIFFLPHKLGAVSVEHDSNDIKQLVDASEYLAREIKGRT